MHSKGVNQTSNGANLQKISQHKINGCYNKNTRKVQCTDWDINVCKRLEKLSLMHKMIYTGNMQLGQQTKEILKLCRENSRSCTV